VIEALLLDLGNVVLEVDFRRTFRRWAASSGVDPAILHERWAEDQAYRAHERGELSFEAYVDALGHRLGVAMSREDWQSGWNDVFVGPYPGVQERLADLAGRMPLYAFTNTNATHELAWRLRYGDALRHFREIFVSSRLGVRKPDPAAFEQVAAAMGVTPDAILFLDDNPHNVEGARQAGLASLQVTSEDEVLAALEPY
jgi:putative hydrolase of the HAD superfamily